MTKPIPLPSYKSPPVNEVVCGMRYHKPDNLRINHIGLLWDKIRSEYPVVQHATPIGSNISELLMDQTTGLPLPRVWFINDSDDQLVQFQFDRFYFNWRHRQGEYPRYPYVIEKFENVLDNIEDLFKTFELGKLNPIECELSYINHLEKGREWEESDDLSKIFSDFIWTKIPERFLPTPAKITWQTEFPLPDNKGKLLINLKSATRTEDSMPIFVLELIARGIGESEDKKAILEWFELAREWIVRGFTDLTTPHVHEIWERHQ